MNAATFSWSRVTAVSRRQVLVQVRNPGYWFGVVVLPIVDALLFGSIGAAYADGDGGRSVEALLIGILLFHVIWQLSLSASLGFLEEIWSRNLLNLFATPLRELEFLAGLAIVSLGRAALGLGLIAGVAVGLYAVDPTSAGITLLPSLALLIIFGWALSLLVIGLVLRYGASAEVFSWGLLVLLMPFSGVFYPVEYLPDPLEPIAHALPLTLIFDAVRFALDGGGVAWGLLGLAAIGAAVLSVACFAFAAWMLRSFRARGLITRDS